MFETGRDLFYDGSTSRKNGLIPDIEPNPPELPCWLRWLVSGSTLNGRRCIVI
jgi:hypothetical protein